MAVDLFVVTGDGGMVPAESVCRQQMTAVGAAMLSTLRADATGAAGGLFRTGGARVSVKVGPVDKLHFELVTGSKPGPKPVAVFANEMHRLRKGGWKLGVPWGVAFAAFDDDAEPTAWNMAREQSRKLEGVRLEATPPRVPWCVLVASSHAELQVLADFVGGVIDALYEARQVAAPVDLGGV